MRDSTRRSSSLILSFTSIHRAEHLALVYHLGRSYQLTLCCLDYELLLTFSFANTIPVLKLSLFRRQLDSALAQLTILFSQPAGNPGA